jgi:hypothetical protein
MAGIFMGNLLDGVEEEYGVRAARRSSSRL